jgi:hypothetical protein
MDTIKTASDLKRHVESAGHEPYFFTRKTMAFFGDTMKNYGVCRVIVDTPTEKAVGAYELYRRRPVKHGLKKSAYFHEETFKRIFPTEDNFSHMAQLLDECRKQ